MIIFIGLLIPFLGTALGSAMVFFMKNKINNKVQKFLLGFASGVMLAASIWSLLIPSMDMAEEQGKITWLPAAIGFLLGIVFLLILDVIIPHLHISHEKPEGMKSKFKKTTMMVLAVTLHNIPEGMAAGATFADTYEHFLSLTGKMSLEDVGKSVGIDLQDPAFWQNSIDMIKDDIDLFEKLLKQLV